MAFSAKLSPVWKPPTPSPPPLFPPAPWASSPDPSTPSKSLPSTFWKLRSRSLLPPRLLPLHPALPHPKSGADFRKNQNLLSRKPVMSQLRLGLWPRLRLFFARAIFDPATQDTCPCPTRPCADNYRYILLPLKADRHSNP